MTPRCSHDLIFATPAELLEGLELIRSMYGALPQIAKRLHQNCHEIRATYRAWGAAPEWVLDPGPTHEARQTLRVVDAIDAWVRAHGVERKAYDGTPYLGLPEGGIT